MRIGVINVANLTKVRETFRPGWRTVVTFIFLFSVFFVLATFLNTVTITLLLLILVVYLAVSVPSWDGAAVSVAFFAGLFMLMVYGKYLVVPCYALLRSLTPFGRWKAYRQQVVYSMRLWSGEWKGIEQPREAGPGEKLY